MSPDRALYRDLVGYREPEPISLGDTCFDVISGIVVMLAIIAFGFWIGGLFG